MVDTSLFAPEFQTRLVSSLSDDHPLDDFTDGTIIHADNFQALNLLQARYRGQVKCIYIDPPYNTGGDGFIYKDNYQHSSWLAMMNDRIAQSLPLLSNTGLNFVSISDSEQSNLKHILDSNFNGNYLGTIEWNSTKSVTNTALISVGHTHNFIHAKNLNYYIANRTNFRLPDTQDGFSNPDNDPRGLWKADPFQVGGERPNQLYEITNPKTGISYRPNKGNSWKNDFETFKKLLADNRIVFGVSGEAAPQRKRFWFEAEERGKVAKTWWDDVETTTNGTHQLKNLFNEPVFSNPKPVGLLFKFLQLGLFNNNQLVLDYFAGSGTTAHAVINLNREDGGKRKYILVEQGEYFNTVLKPRIQKAVYAAEWKDGKPVPDKDTGSLKGIAHAVKVLKLESYEDTLNNLLLRRPDLADMGRQPENMARDYLLHYMLDVESRGSLLDTDAFKKPFDYQMDIATDSAGASVRTGVDLVETFNYLLGLTVEAVDDKRFSEGYVMIEGSLKNERVLLVWRDCEKWDYDTLPKLLAKKQIAAGDSEYAEIYINGDHTLPTVFQDNDADGGAIRSLKIRSIEEAFLRLMFEEA